MEELMACACAAPPFHFLDFYSSCLGQDTFGEDIRLDQCKTCGSYWLVYLLEWPHYSKSGRWWCAPISNSIAARISVEEAKRFIESLEWCYVGGSFYKQGCHKQFSPISVL
jgi:hypothetical protein